MKILHVSTPKSWRGGEQQLAYLATELRKLKVEQALLVPRNSPMEHFCREQNFAFQTAPKRFSFDPAFAARLARYAREQKADLIHAHDSHAHTFAVMARDFFGLKAPIVLSRRVDFAVGKSWLSRYKYNHPAVEKIICVSEVIRQVMMRCIARSERLSVVHSGVDLDKFSEKIPGKLRQEYAVPDDHKIVGNVAALADHKDYFTFVDTVAKLVQQNVKARYFIIGDGSQKAEIWQYVKSQKLEDEIIFTGFRTDINDILPELDVLLFTSKMEGLGTIVLDAYAAGVPVVATRGGGIPEMVIENQTALLADVKAPEALAKNVQKILDDEDFAQNLQAVARGHVKQFSQKETARKTLEVYKQVTSA